MAGRPRGTSNKVKYPCMHCVTEKTEDAFFTARHSIRWNFSNKKALVCKECMERLLADYTEKYGEYNAVAICCSILDIPFYAAIYKSITENSTAFTIGIYIKVLNGGQYRSKSFLNSIIDGEFGKTITEVREERENKWSRRDMECQERILRIMKYDPFEDYDVVSRRLMFNVACDYLSNDDILDDPHKLQCVMEIVKLYQHADAINKQLIEELNGSGIDDVKIRNFTSVKKDCLDSINKLAKENGISVSSVGKTNKGVHSLSYYVKLFDDTSFNKAEVNLFDVKTCESFRQFQDISNESILGQIRLNSDELGEMFETQYKMIQAFRNRAERLAEENRLLKIKLDDSGLDYFDALVPEIDGVDYYSYDEVVDADVVDADKVDGD